MAEFENLAKLLDAIKLTTAARDKLKEAQEKMNNAEAGSAKEDAIAEFVKFSQEVIKLKETEDSYRKIACTFLVDEREVEVKETEQPDITNVTETDAVKTETTPKSGSKSALSFKLPQLDKFKRGDNFAKFCEKFLEYVTLGNIGGDNLPLIFLQLVDDFTKEKLKKISLTPGQSRDAKSFLDEYMKKMCPPHEGSTYRAMLAEMKQKSSGEGVEEFAYRISETASRAFAESQELLREDACLSSFRKGLLDPDLKMKLHEDVTITTFERAVEEACRLEGIRASLGMTAHTESTGSDHHDVLAINTSERSHDGDQHGISCMDDRQPKQRKNYRNQHESSQPRGQGHYQPRFNRDNRNPPRNQNHYQPSPMETSHEPQNQRRHDQRQQGGNRSRKTIRCYNCNGLNHIAKNCTASLNM